MLITRPVSGLLLAAWASIVYAQEWEEIPATELRLKNEIPVEVKPEPEPEPSELQDPSFYQQGEGTISGAFGILFGTPLESNIISSRPGWHQPPNLPSQFAYYGVVKPFTMEVFGLKPPNVPAVLRDKKASFKAYTNYRNHPIWISASVKGKLEKIVPLLTRKYGEPETDLIEGIDSGYTYYNDGINRIRVSSKNQVIDYFDIPAFTDYMKQRNKSLRKKFLDEDRSRLTQYEQSLMRIADQIAMQGTSLGSAYGVEFGKRVSFLVKPDVPQSFDAPVKFSDLGKGTYSMVVSPDLQPISIRYEVPGSKLELGLYKGLIDHALKLNFGGFLKNSANHSVITVSGKSVSAMIRSGKFSLTFINTKEQKLLRAREQAIADKIRAAEQERKRLEAIEKRKKEIKDEEAF